MAVENIFQHPVATTFFYPLLLIFFILFAILERTKILGDDKSQINALVAAVVSMIFVGSVFPKEVVSNLILFLTVAIIVIFVVLVLWGFATGGELTKDFMSHTGIKWSVGVVTVIAVIIAILWSTGIEGGIYDLLFGQSWSSGFWTNFLFIVVVAAALAITMIKPKSS